MCSAFSLRTIPEEILLWHTPCFRHYSLAGTAWLLGLEEHHNFRTEQCGTSSLTSSIGQDSCSLGCDAMSLGLGLFSVMKALQPSYEEAGNHSPTDISPYCRRSECLKTPLWESQISHLELALFALSWSALWCSSRNCLLARAVWFVNYLHSSVKELYVLFADRVTIFCTLYSETDFTCLQSCH
jgi:hypothetical protein